MRIPYGFELISDGTLEVNKDEANIVSMIFDFYMAGASLGKVVDMLHSKQISSPTGKLKWTRATVDHLLSNGKYVAVVGLEKFLDVQFEKAARCNKRVRAFYIVIKEIRPSYSICFNTFYRILMC